MKIKSKKRIFVGDAYVDYQGYFDNLDIVQTELFSPRKLHELSLEDIREIKEDLKKIYSHCDICSFNCGVNRFENQKGVCGLNAEGGIYKYYVDTALENFLIPSINLYFWGCNLNCPFCQEMPIMRYPKVLLTSKDIPEILELVQKARQEKNIRTILFVGGEPALSLLFIVNLIEQLKKFQIFDLMLAIDTNLYVSKPILFMIDKLMDVIIADLKFTHLISKKILKINDYWEVVTSNLKILYKSAHSNMVIRHLVIPGLIEVNTLPILEWIKYHLPETIVSILTTFHPMYRANEVGLRETLDYRDRDAILKKLEKLGLKYFMSEV